MKFSFKLLLWTMVLLAAALGLSGFYFVNYVFETSLEREVGQALDENSILRFAFETAALNVPAQYGILPDSRVEEIASNLETGGQSASRYIRISGEEWDVLYASDGFGADQELLHKMDETMRSYRIIRQNGHYYVQTGVMLLTLNRILYMETMRDVTEVFDERAVGFSLYRRMTLLILLAGTVIMFLISSWLTKPIRMLTKATKQMADGDYAYRAEQVSRDELGQLTCDFNVMANALEENINEMEAEIQAREDFVAAFAHELKTPLTAIIGYADMLRSHKLDEEKSFMSANYIYTEGKRLETMSFRLLDIIVTKRDEVRLQRIAADAVFSYLKEMFGNGTGMEFAYRYEEGPLWAEGDLIKTVLVNLIDNACKASEPGGLIEITGSRTEGGYRFLVKDYGVGIPEEEQHKITQAFYMVDKSRARSKNGAGLGLALCAEMLKLHGSVLEVESSPGMGTAIGFLLPDRETGKNGEGSGEEENGK